MSLAVTLASQVTVVETLGGVFVGADSSYQVDGMNTSAGLTASTTPPVTKYSASRLTLSSGSGTIDLTSLPDANGTAAAVTFNGLKLQVVKLRNKSTNANEITVSEGASNGHSWLGSGWTITLQPGDEILWKGNDNSGVPDVGSGSKTIDVAGTGSQVLEYAFVAG